MKARLTKARSFFATQADPYAGADLGNAQRLGALLWSLVTALVVVLWVSSPPTEAIGGVGWPIAGALALCGAGLVACLRRGLIINTFERMLTVAYASVLAISILQWLSGGVNSPYERVLLLPILFVAMLHPPRRIAPFMGCIALAMAAPFVYDGWNADAAGATFATFVIWSCLAVLGSVLMSGVRAQRLDAAAEEAKAREEARVDALTSLHNRRRFDEALETEVERSRRTNVPLTVAMIDIHDFKQINDTWGHAEGDRCLRDVARALESAVRRPDLCFRWGGDEFALILTGIGAGESRPLALRLADVIADNAKRPDGEPMEIAFAVTELRIGMNAEELTELAGMALTGAKSQPTVSIGNGLEV